MDQALLAHTHGQPATPTRLGKEIYVWVDRLLQQISLLKQVPHSGKFGGATGQFNAHAIAYPSIHWPDFGDAYVYNAMARKIGFLHASDAFDIAYNFFLVLSQV